MVFSTVGGVSATMTKDPKNKVVNDCNDIYILDNPTVKEIQNVIGSSNNGDTILIKGSPTDNGEIKSDKVLTIKGEDCIFNKIHWIYTKDISFENITFKESNSDYGGAIKSDGSVSLTNYSFDENSAVTGGGAIYSQTKVDVVSSLFNGNVAGNSTIYGSEGGAICSVSDGVNIIGSNFTSNFAYDYGGAVWSDDGVTVESSKFMNNSVTDNRGGAIYMDDSYDLKVSGSAFYGNHANDKGGAIYCEGNFAHIYLNSFNSFENNTAKEGSVVFTDGYFDSIWQNWWGTMKPNWDSGLLVEWKTIGPNKKHEDSCPLTYNPNL